MKRKRVLAVVLLSCMISQAAMSREYNINFDHGDKNVSFSGQSTGSVTNSGNGNVSVNTTNGNTFTGSLKNSGNGNFTNSGNVVVGKNAKGENDKIENSKGKFLNNGNITVNEGGSIDNKDGFVNNGNITVNEGGALVNDGNFVSSGSLTNKGNFTNSGFFNGSFTNDGLLKNLKEATMFLTENTTNNKDIETDGLFFISKGTEFTNKGEADISNSGQFHNSGTYKSETEMINTGTFTNDGSYTGGLINDGGTASNIGGTMDKVVNQNGGLFVNSENSQLTTAENKDGSTFKNTGIVSGNVTNSSGGNFTNSGEVTGEVTNDNAIFNNTDNGKLGKKFTNKNGGVFNNTSKNKVSGEIDNDNATVNNSGEIESVSLSNGAVVNNNAEGKLGSITGSSSTVNNSSVVSGTVEAAEGGGLTVNNRKDGKISGTVKGETTVNNSGTMENTNIQGGAIVNNNIDGKITGNTNLTQGSSVYNDGLISGIITVDNNSYLHLGANTQFDKDAKVNMGGHLDLMNDHFDDFRANLGLMRPGTSVSVDISSATGQTDKLWAIRGVTLEDFNFIPDTLLSYGNISKEQLAKNMGLYSSQLNIKDGVSHKALSPF